MQFNFFADGPFVLENLARVAFALFEALSTPLTALSRSKMETSGFGAGVGGFKFQFSRHARKDIFLCGFAGLQLGGGVLEFFIFDELADEFPARVFAFVLAFDCACWSTGSNSRLLIYMSVEAITRNSPAISRSSWRIVVNVFDELRGELGEVDLVNVHFLLFDEIKQQIERAFEDLELNFVFGHELQKF